MMQAAQLPLVQMKFPPTGNGGLETTGLALPIAAYLAKSLRSPITPDQNFLGSPDAGRKSLQTDQGLAFERAGKDPFSL